MTRFIFHDHYGASLLIDNMPVWQGMQARPGVQQTEPFKLEQNKDGLIVQRLENNFEKEVIGRYGKEDYNFITAPPGATAWSTASALKRLVELEKAIGNSDPKKILEIGCGNTWFGQAFCKSRTPDVYVCLDPALDNERVGNLLAVKDYFPSKLMTYKDFDLILAYNVLEHVIDPLNMLSSIEKILSKNGRAIITVPDCEKQLLVGDLNCFIHEHITYFTQETLFVALERCGLSVEWIVSNNDLFTLSVMREEMLPTDNIRHSSRVVLLDAVSNSVAGVLDELSSKICGLVGAGAKVGFHGATQGLNTFLHMTGIGQKEVSVFDTDPAKAGLFLPACLFPVTHVEDSKYHRQDFMFVSALSFYDDIEKYALNSGFKPEQIIKLCDVQQQ